ncbi:unnamed protein product [Adineta ricciae]|uniref:Protein kinase domain-containing protein n=1 Tax=Adineta ricciae TaxID=249248 RepID=A0A814QZM5_ADIRI|nr:unnamed protein product [Adineta ricciae]CAF1126733.1 unnamed protein product [Adineta ricciae]
MGAKSSKNHRTPFLQSHHYHQHFYPPVSQPHVAWDHGIAQATDNALRFAKFNNLPTPSSDDVFFEQPPPFVPPKHNHSSRRKHHHSSSSHHKQLGIRKSQSTGNLASPTSPITPNQFFNDQSKRRHRNKSSSSQTSAHSSQISNISKSTSKTSCLDHTPTPTSRQKRTKTSYDPPMTFINASDIKTIREIGRGNFGTVYYALYKNSQDVAVKTLNSTDGAFTTGAMGPNEESMKELLQEAKMMMHLKHANVLHIVGVTFFGDQQQLSLVTDFMKNGSLLDYLKKHRELFLKWAAPTVMKKLNNFSQQIYAAMSYLEDREIVHRDLAARNCLIGENDTLKVGDFGLTRLTDFGLYQATNTVCAPRWTAPEALFSSKYSSRSDVWSYGITLWEVYSLGDRPYGNVHNSVIYDIVKNSSNSIPRYLPKPRRFCSDEAYTHIILLCLTHNVTMRPRFRDLQQRIATILV